MPFAEGTSVPVSRSREELQRVLEKARVEEVGFVTGSGGRARVAFRLNGLAVSIDVPVLDPARLHETRYTSLADLVAQEERRRWRALLLVVKAKLEAIESGISTLEQEFLAHIRLADGRSIGDVALPMLKQLAVSGDGPRLLEDGLR